MSSPQILLALWVSQPVIQAAIATVLYRRKLHKEFPAFFSYIVIQIPIFCIDLPTYYFGSQYLYFDVYWVSAALNLVLAFRIIYEIFLDIFKPYHALKDLGAALFKWAAFIMVLISAVLISVAPAWQDPLLASILVVQRCIAVVQCGLVVFLLAFSRYLGVNWRRFTFGIALGFGVLSSGDLLTTVLYSGIRSHHFLASLISVGAYDVGMLVCLGYSVLHRRSEMIPALVPQRWDEALLEIQPSHPDADSLIPMFEHMVDQALSKADKTHA